jgi:hypothetical protein
VLPLPRATAQHPNDILAGSPRAVREMDSTRTKSRPLPTVGLVDALKPEKNAGLIMGVRLLHYAHKTWIHSVVYPLW